MSFDVASVITVALGIVGLAAAVLVVFTREIMRMAVALGVFLLAIAGFYVLAQLDFLAVAQVFLYVGGVLVLMLFAIMLVQRSSLGHPVLESRHDIGSAAVGIGLFVMLWLAVSSVESRFGEAPMGASPSGLSELLLGELLVQFELAGLLLLMALVAVLVATGGDDR